MAIYEQIRALSTITNKDYAEIVSTFITLTEPKYRCGDCKRKYAKDPEKMNKQRAAMACDYFDPKPRHQYRGDFNNKENPTVLYRNCIGNHYNGRWASIINYFPKWDSGILPFKGGYLEQPAKFVEIMDLVHNLTIENNQEKERQQEIINRTKSGRRPSKR